MNTPEPFDLGQVYDNEIAPLMTQIIKICQREGMPMLASFCFALGKEEYDPEREDYCTTILPREDWSPKPLKDALREIRREPGFLALTITKP